MSHTFSFKRRKRLLVLMTLVCCIMHLQWLDVFIKFTCTCLTISIWWWNKSKMVCVWKRINNLYWINFQSHISYAIPLGCITEFFSVCNRIFNSWGQPTIQRNLLILIHLYVLFRFCLFCIPIFTFVLFIKRNSRTMLAEKTFDNVHFIVDFLSWLLI